jgi:SAM-dependent methyltransferase
MNFVAAERNRIEVEYRRRAEEIDPRLYAPWQPAEMLSRASRGRMAVKLLHRALAFPKAGHHCLEIGFGKLGWLGELLNWGVRQTDIHGIDLDSDRVALARDILSASDLRVGDATSLPWPDNSFQLVIISTVLSSVLDSEVRRLIASEAARVIAPCGALLFYDFAYNNPGNPNVRKVGRGEIRQLFPTLRGEVCSLTLAPPIARFIAPRSWPLAVLLETVPIFRTHLLGILTKSKERNNR